MKFLGLFLLVLVPVLGQNAGSDIIDFGENDKYNPTYIGDGPFRFLQDVYQYSWEITRNPNGSKSFYFVAYSCDFDQYNPTSGDPECHQLSESAAKELGPLDEALDEFAILPDVLGGFDNPPEYGPFVERAKRQSTVVQPPTPPDPTMVLFDGLGNAMVRFDLTTNSIVSQIPFFSYGVASNFALRPTASGPQNEVWVNNAGLSILVMDLGSQSVLATIPNPPNVGPGNIVFTISGNTALESVYYNKPDSLGNMGAILAFDAATRTVTSTLPLKAVPFQMLMAPDGLTAYILGNQTITYYDVLSGTASLTASIPYSGTYGYAQPVFVHPDGTRLFLDAGYGLTVFDLTSRQVTNTFNYNLAKTATTRSVNMSQDGSTVWVSDSLNNVTILDTRYGIILGTYQTSPMSLVFPGPVY